MSKLREFPTDFGIFYPTGWIVIAFPEKEVAEQARRDLLTGGYEEDDVKLLTSEEVIPAAESQLKNTGWLAQLGMADEMVARHLEAAKKGSAFLVVYAPSDAEAKRVMNVVKRRPFEFAHRYHRFVIEEMK